MLNRKQIWISFAVFFLMTIAGVLARGIWLKTELDTSSRSHLLSLIEGTFSFVEENDYSEIAKAALSTTNVVGDINGVEAYSLIDRLSDARSLLGQLEIVEGVYGGALIPLLPFGSTPETASYEADLGFTKGSATLVVNMRLSGGQWRLDSFSLNAPALNAINAM